jgi:hypothetical protein
MANAAAPQEVRMASVECQIKTCAGAVAALIGAAVLATAIPGDAYAVISQQASVIHASCAGGPICTSFTDFAEERSPPDVLEGVSAAIGGPGFTLEASVGPFGNLGMTGQMSRVGTLSGQIIILNSEFFNQLPSPQRAAAQFIVDGGRLAMLAGTGSRLNLLLQVSAIVRDPTTTLARDELFVAQIALEQTADGMQFESSGESLDETFDGHFAVDIPLSLQTLDLGLIPAAGSIQLTYRLMIFADIHGFNEITAYQFSDPLQLDGTGEFPTVIFSEPAAVAEPPALLVLAASLTLIGATRRRQTECG